MKGITTTLILLIMAPAFAHGATILTENFDDIGALAGWAMINNSSAGGSTGWFQGNPGVFPSHSGAADSYIAANFENADFGGNISNWLLTPELTLDNGIALNFYSRANAVFPDRLEVRFSTNGGSTDVGTSDTSVGDFSNLLLTINPALDPSGYPDSWTMFSAVVSGLPGAASGRFAFRYFVPDTSFNGDYIGIDSVSVESSSTPPPAPEPGSLLTLAMGLAALTLGRRHIRFSRKGESL